MAQTESKIKLIFDGVERGVVAAAAKSKAAVESLGDASDKASTGLGRVGKGMVALGAAHAAVQVVGGVAGALEQLAPAALILPGALLGGAAAMTTFKMATAGFGDAIKAGLSGDMEKFAKATKGMAPEMRDAAKAVADFKPRIDDLKKAVQGEFWDEFAGGIRSAGEKYLPLLQEKLPMISRSLGGIAWEGLRASQTPFFTGAVSSILDDTRDTLDNFAPVLGDVSTGLVGIGKVGARFLPGLTAGVGDLTTKFATWVEQNSQVGGKLEHWISQGLSGFGDLISIIRNVGSIAGSVFKGLGGEINSPLERIKELTAQVAEFLKTAAAQDGLRALGETLRVVGEVVGKVVMTALRELAPTLVKLAPVAQQVATTLGDMLVAALETVGPLIRGVATVLGDFPGLVGFATTAVVAFVVAMKTIKAVNAVSDLLGIGGAILGVGDKAKGAEGKVGGLVSKLGGLKAIGAAVALGAVAVAMDDINIKAAGGADKLQGFEENLHDIRQILTGDWGNPFEDINAQLDQTRRNIQAGQSDLGKFFGWLNQKLAAPLPPITFDVNTGPAQAQVDDFIGAVNKETGTVNINGNDNPAGFALREIIREIDAGKGTITIDGRDMPAQDALKYVVGLINNSRGTVTVNGQTVPAGQALADILNRTNASHAAVQVGANTSGAQSAVNSFIRLNSGQTINIGVRLTGYGSVGGTALMAAAHGRASGGPIVGPGTGTSDTAGLYALSNGEYVATAEQVRNAGGPGAFGRLMDALGRGPVSGRAGGGPVDSGLSSAVNELYSRFQSGGSVFEDMSFRGMSSILAKYNDQIADMFYGQGGKFDRTSVMNWLWTQRQQQQQQKQSNPAPSGGSGPVVRFVGNTSDALATVIMQMIRTGKIQIQGCC